VAITYRGPQPPSSRSMAPPPPGPDARPPSPDRVGVVFVHGIGTQTPSETFLDWSKPIVKLLTTWRAEQPGLTPDPVVRSEFTFSGATPPFLELDIPEVTDESGGVHPRRTFVITEAFWAAQVRAPSLGDAAAYVFRAFPRILRKLASSYEVSSKQWRQRLDQELKAAEAEGRQHTGAIRELRRRRRWSWIDTLDSVQRFLSVLAYFPALVIGGFVLLVYAPFRLIPIKPIQDAAVLRSVDNFLTTWFGDLPDILDDPVQAGNVRARLAQSIDHLVRQQGCGSIVIIAHSGGAIVSFTTLLDPTYWDNEISRFEVQRLITIGEALAIGWVVDRTGTRFAKGLPDRLTGDLQAARPDLQWTDFWATYDPAPAGPLKPPRGVHVPHYESRPVTNRMSVIEDHGAYWENDEGFLIPLVRYLDEARGDPDRSRFFRDSAERAVRIERRRQRVGVLALWRWIAVLAGAVPIVGGTIAWAASNGTVPGPAGFGRAVGAWFGTIPFHQLITNPLDFLSDLAGLPAGAADLGQWLVGSVVIALLFVLIGLVGLKLWDRWDDRERDIARREPLKRVHRMDVAVVSAIVLGITLVAAAWSSIQVFG
jgi:hypothetical protein